MPRILAERPPVPWFELLTDNHLAAGGALCFQAEAIAERYPVTLHGVSMNLGGTDPLDEDYLTRVADLARRTGARAVSDHLAFTSFEGHALHDLLPLPWTEEALAVVAKRVTRAQDLLGRGLLIENISSYVAFTGEELDEADFLRALCERTGCGLLLDVNNVYVNAVNHGRDAQEFLRRLPWSQVGEIHVAGHECRGKLLLDSHGAPVSRKVVELLEEAVRRAPWAPVLLEWDTRLPDWDTLWAEAQRIEAIRRAVLTDLAA